MSFSQRVATFATMTIAIVGLCASTPGVAAQLDRTMNAAATLPVPQAALVPAIATLQVQPLPASSDSTKSADPADDDTVSYDSLADAVDAQREISATSDDLTCLAGAVYFESKGEPLDGQLAVAEVILNRSKSGRFPESVCGVVTQPGQFSFVRSGRVPDVASNAAYRTATAVARVALAGRWDSSAADAMYFHARRASPGWGRIKVAAIGNQVFYR